MRLLQEKPTSTKITRHVFVFDNENISHSGAYHSCVLLSFAAWSNGIRIFIFHYYIIFNFSITAFVCDGCRSRVLKKLDFIKIEHRFIRRYCTTNPNLHTII